MKFLIILKEGGFKTRMILQVHDELLFELSPGEQELVTNIVRTEMEGSYDLNVPLTVEIGSGENWASAH